MCRSDVKEQQGKVTSKIIVKNFERILSALVGLVLRVFNYTKSMTQKVCQIMISTSEKFVTTTTLLWKIKLFYNKDLLEINYDVDQLNFLFDNL